MSTESQDYQAALNNNTLSNDALFGLGRFLNEVKIAIPTINGVVNMFNDDDRADEDVATAPAQQRAVVQPPVQNWLSATKNYASEINIPLLAVGGFLLAVAGVLWVFNTIRGK